MKFEIKARITGNVLFTAEIGDDIEPRFRVRAALEIAVKAGAYLADAYLAGANLADVDLAGAYLADANLAGANLAGANLAGAYLAGANLADANLADANLARADLADANLAGAKKLPFKIATPAEAVANLDKVREIILDDSRRLNMGHWHADESKWVEHTCAEEAMCGTTHCLAGWLQVCATDEDVRRLPASTAGFAQAPMAAPMFYAPHEEVLRWLKDREYTA